MAAAGERWRVSSRPAFLAAFAVLATSAIGGCSDDCSHFKGPLVRSPDGQWIAQVHSDLCGGRILALGSESTIVTLSRHKAHYADLSTVAFSAEGLHEEDVQLHWASRYQLELTVPNHSDIYALMATYNGIDISVRYVPSNPEERARWVNFKREQAKELDESLE